MTDQEFDRNESATPYKLEQARKRGQMAKSADVVSAIVFAAAVITLYAQGWERVKDMVRFDRRLLQQGLGVGLDMQMLWDLLEQCLRSGLSLLAPLLLVVMLAAILGNLGQTGFNFTAHPLKPDWQRINPATGFKRLWTLRTLFDAGRACVKLLVLGWVVVAALRALVPQFSRVATLPPLAQLHLLVEDVASLGIKVALALVLVALVDLAYTRRDFGKQMRMSRREVRDESKHREGDPRIRARLRELRREMLKRTRSLRKTRDADVVLTNPTHVAVALMYRHGEMDAPVVVSKGKGAMAAAVRKIAQRHHIPVVQNPALARALYAQSELDRQIPPAMFTQVARIMVWVLAMRRARDGAYVSTSARSSA